MASQLQYRPQRPNRLSEERSITLLYHDIFGYPLKEQEFVAWAPGEKLKLNKARPRVSTLDGYYFVEGGEETVLKRIENESYSREKMKLLSVYRSALESEKNILFVGITGSLAMSAASKNSDIDLMIITKHNTLWATRLKLLIKLRKLKVSVRRAGKSEQEDKLCINIWMDERDLKIVDKNPYTAHELAQVVPLINKNRAYERLLSANLWILDYWPNSTAFNTQNPVINSDEKPVIFNIQMLIERVAYLLQRVYMIKKISRETVTPTRAFFHPMDWSRRVALELKKRGVGFY